MHYLMEDVSILFNNEHKKTSLLVQENKIRYIGYSIPKFNVMKVNVQAFYLTPSSVYYSPDIPNFSFDSFKVYFSEEFLLKGCGCIITDFTIQYEYQFAEQLSRKRQKLYNSPIDYVLGVKLAANKLTASIIKKCTRERIPALFIELTDARDLEKISWGWLRKACHPYKPLFIPDISKVNNPVVRKYLLRKWSKILENEKLNYLHRPLCTSVPLNIDIVKKIGLYPKKGVLKQGGELNYNLILKDRVYKIVNVDNLKPNISVVNGKLVNINQKPIFSPGYGNEIRINQTGLFI